MTEQLTHKHTQGVAPRVEEEVMSTGKERIVSGQAMVFWRKRREWQGYSLFFLLELERAYVTGYLTDTELIILE